MSPQDRAALVALVDSLFVNGSGDVAERLVLTSRDGRDLGGWCRGAIVDRLVAALAAAPAGEPVGEPATRRDYRCRSCGYEKWVETTDHRPMSCCRTNCNGRTEPVGEPTPSEARLRERDSYIGERGQAMSETTRDVELEALARELLSIAFPPHAFACEAGAGCMCGLDAKRQIIADAAAALRRVQSAEGPTRARVETLPRWSLSTGGRMSIYDHGRYLDRDDVLALFAPPAADAEPESSPARLIIHPLPIPGPPGVCWKTAPRLPSGYCQLPAGHDTGPSPTPHQWERSPSPTSPSDQKG